MGERGQRVIVRDRLARRFYSQWGGQQCMQYLREGERGLEEDISSCKPYGCWVIPEFAEGGYLIDFDAKNLLLYSWDDYALHHLLEEITPAWPGWKVEIIEDGVPGFEKYIEERGIAVYPWDNDS